MLFPGKAALLSPQIMLTIFSFKGFIGKAFPFPINHSIFFYYKNVFKCHINEKVQYRFALQSSCVLLDFFLHLTTNYSIFSWFLPYHGDAGLEIAD